MNAIRSTQHTARKLLSAATVAIIAFFELCFTGRADGAWRLARAENNVLSTAERRTSNAKRNSNYPIFTKGAGVPDPPPSAPNFIRSASGVRRSAILLAITVIIAVFSAAPGTLNAERSMSPSGQSFHQLEDGSERIAIQEASEMGKEAPSSPMVAEKAAVAGCFIFSLMIIGVVYLNVPRK